MSYFIFKTSDMKYRDAHRDKPTKKKNKQTNKQTNKKTNKQKTQKKKKKKKNQTKKKQQQQQQKTNRLVTKKTLSQKNAKMFLCKDLKKENDVNKAKTKKLLRARHCRQIAEEAKTQQPICKQLNRQCVKLRPQFNKRKGRHQVVL